MVLFFEVIYLLLSLFIFKTSQRSCLPALFSLIKFYIKLSVQLFKKIKNKNQSFKSLDKI